MNVSGTSRRPARVVLVPTGLAWVVAGSLLGAAWAGDSTPLPVPPLPEDVGTGAVVLPVSLDRGQSGPLPLAGSPAAGQPTAGRAVPVGAAGEWTVLAAIVAAFGILAAFRFQQSRRGGRSLPPDVYELLGEGSLGGQHGVRVVRFGPRTLLVGVSASGCQTLASLDDPQATERVVAACLGARQPARPGRPAPRQAASAPVRAGPAGGEAA